MDSNTSAYVGHELGMDRAASMPVAGEWWMIGGNLFVIASVENGVVRLAGKLGPATAKPAEFLAGSAARVSQEWVLEHYPWIFDSPAVQIAIQAINGRAALSRRAA